MAHIPSSRAAPTTQTYAANAYRCNVAGTTSGGPGLNFVVEDKRHHQKSEKFALGSHFFVQH